MAGLGIMGGATLLNKRIDAKFEEAEKEYAAEMEKHRQRLETYESLTDREKRYVGRPPEPEPLEEPRHANPAWGIIPCAAGALFIALSCFYSQDIGESVILRNLGGSIAGHTTEAGFHPKAPWQDVLTWDIRNRQVNFFKDSEYAYDGGSYTGSEVTINDSSGTKANIDIQVIYSIDADKVEELYAEYGTQEAFVTNYVSNDLRATAREVAGRFDTITLLTDRAQFTSAVQESLADQWDGNGVIVEQVQVQDIRYADSITDAYADAQSAEVAKQKALNAQETAKVEAETKRIEAEGEAEANRVLTESLTDEVLRQEYIDALKSAAKNGGLIVVPEGSQPIVGTN